MPRKTLPFRVTQDGHGIPVVLLGDMDITPYIAAEGLQVDFIEYGPSIPRVRIEFAPGALDFDLDVELLSNLLRAAHAKAAG